MSAGAERPAEPVVARPASTVLLLRDGPDGRLQVFLQRRVTGMAFGGGMTVFPGGGVDRTDLDDPAPWSGPAPRWWADRLGTEPTVAAGFVRAAVRETFEESGVLLASRPDGTPVDQGVLGEARADVVARTRTFGDVLAEAGLVLRADLLRLWARWITPVVQPRRYDTVFFTALVPEGQEADAHTTEAVEASWWSPSDALAAHRDKEIGLMRPTLAILTDIARHPDAASLRAAGPDGPIRPILPMVVGPGPRVLLPGDPGYDPDVAAGVVRTGGAR
ncbi:NUDIX hydrolase [Pseudonocardia dioxanivorans]|uniref:NUDIX hydrolase n=1 Tax=Pseudonocardia dioxanivorans TaxID=240495 RepID=UPI000CCFE964|nr:NUDIX hydrolase [Pseudonocardia dioxanivorans]